MNDDTDRGSSGPRNVLLQTGGDGDCEESVCMDLLGVEEPSDVDVLFVTFTKSADDRLDALKRHADAPPAKVGVVSVEVGGSSGGDRAGGARGAGGPTVRYVSDPSDLTGVGIAISEFLSAWSGDGNRTVVCFESLTALLQYVDASRVFQFCNEITSKFERAGARAHFHITPEAHERQELSVLSSLFDGRVSAADLGDGTDAGAAAGGSAGSAPSAVGDVPERVDTADDAAAEAGADPIEDDPFEYAVADAADDGSEEGASDEADRSSEPVEPADGGADTDSTAAEPDDESSDPDGAEAPESEENDAPPDDAPPDADPADLVSSVIAGETVGADAGPSLDADIPDPEASDGDAADDARPEATSRRSEQEELQRRLKYIGPDASTPERATGSDDDDEARAEADDSDDGDDAGDRTDKYTFYQRTTATVFGVVAMLVLISFLSAAMPVPIGTDSPGDDGGDLTPTATSEEVAVADSTGENGTTATENTSTPEPTASATPTPGSSSSTSTSSTSGSDGSGSSGGGSTTDPTPTETATPESTPTETATSEPTATETPTDDDSGLIDGVTDTLNDDDDGLL